MSETTPLIPSASTGRARVLRSSAAVAAIGLLLAVVLLAVVSVSTSRTVLESDGEHDSALKQRACFLSDYQLASLFTSVDEHLAKNIYAMSGKSYYPTNPKAVTKCISLFRLLLFFACDFDVAYLGRSSISPASLSSAAQQKRYAALLKEQDTERMMDNGFYRSGAGNPDSDALTKS